MKLHQVRIIGGSWRGRKLSVIDAAGLRPTPDRIRETLFNWLAQDCPGASVLDCFAGSGVLGFEALSRGAAALTLFEQNPKAVAQLRTQLETFDSQKAMVVAGDALSLIAQSGVTFDIVFIDPPYAQPRLRGQVVEQLELHRRLEDGAKLYFEWSAGETFELPSKQLRWIRQKSAGQVNYAIAEWRLNG